MSIRSAEEARRMLAAAPADLDRVSTGYALVTYELVQAAELVCPPGHPAKLPLIGILDAAEAYGHDGPELVPDHSGLAAYLVSQVRSTLT